MKNMAFQILHFLDTAAWLLAAPSVAYIAFYAAAGALLPSRPAPAFRTNAGRKASFLVVYPAYSEDNVIVGSVERFLLQDYPADKYRVAVVSDHQLRSTEERLSRLPVTLLRPAFRHSSKANALRHAVESLPSHYDYIVILDADNVVNADFLSRLNDVASMGYDAIQCHRCAKNSDSSISVLDALSEEVNNTLFRKAHNAVGLSSALIGSGMCFAYHWFSANVGKLATAGEDRELEVLLLSQGVFIKYADHIPVFDEKVSSKENFQRQRQRWMSAQLQCLLAMLRGLPRAVVKGNVNYIDKTLQQMLIPRSMLIVGTMAMSVVTLALAPWHSVKWWLLLAVSGLSLLLAIPRSMLTAPRLLMLAKLPGLAWAMMKGLRHIDRKNRDFIHTRHH